MEQENCRIYTVEILDTIQKSLKILAPSESEAKKIAKQQWELLQTLLCNVQFVSSDFFVSKIEDMNELELQRGQFVPETERS